MARHQPVDETMLYLATAADQFGNGMAGAIFVVYLSMLVNPRYPGAQYAFLSGFAFLLPACSPARAGVDRRKISTRPGYNGFDLFILLSGVPAWRRSASCPSCPGFRRARTSRT
jgi:PAT family beta-lactamase induction signal transducer AmpG